MAKALFLAAQCPDSYGELSDMGGPGPSLGRLYEEGNAYIRRHAEWRGMARTTHVRLC